MGRHADLGRTAALLDDARLVTLVGTGGIGKTRLAVETASLVGDRYADGVWLVELASVHAGDAIADAVVDALGLTPSSTVSATEQVIAFLHERRALLVLDNCEHLLDGARRFVATLLAGAGVVTVLATSREPLGIAGERVMTMTPLAVPADSRSVRSADEARAFDSVRLLEDRASAARGDFRLTDELAAAAALVCNRLDGLPLAIELAATRLRSISLSELADSLTNRFSVLTLGDPTARARHRTLHAMVQWSWELCTRAEQRLWMTMSAFSGGADFEAISAVGTTPDADGPTLDDVDGLVAKSIVSADVSMPRTRYTMLETMMEFGRERMAELADPDVATDLADRHARYYLGLALRGRDAFYTPGQLDWTRRLREERANLADAFDHMIATDAGDGQDALELAAALRFHWICGPLREGARWLVRALTAAPGPSVHRLEALMALTWVAVGRGDTDAAVARMKEAEQLDSTLSSPGWRPRVVMYAAMVKQMTGDLEGADAGFVSALEQLPPDELEYRLLATVLFMLGRFELGDHDVARTAFDDVMGMCESCGETWIQSYGLAYDSFGAWLRGDVDEAEAAALRGLRSKYEFGDELGTAMLLYVLGAVSEHHGDPRRAAVLVGGAEVINAAIGATASAYSAAMDASLRGMVGRVQDGLGPEEFTAARAEGAAMPIEQLLDFAFTRPAPARRSTGPPGGDDPLTAREREVAVLISQGLSNRMIAERLVLSPRTIDGHVERILGKLGFRSRTEVAAWVATGGSSARSS